MFHELEVKSYVRVPPKLLTDNVQESVLGSLNEQYDGFISKDLGIVLSVLSVENVGEGIIIPGDGAAYYETVYKLLVFRPELQEVTLGIITDITDFGAFLNIGPIDGMIHVSQTMDDFVSFNKSGVLTGKETKKILKANDQCRARIIAVSYKDVYNPKIGLTMRQHRLGNIKWIEEELKKEDKGAKK